MFRAVRWPKKDTSKINTSAVHMGGALLLQHGAIFRIWLFFFFIPEHLVCVIIADRGLTERQAFGPSEKSPPQGSPVLCSREKWCPREGRNTKTGFQESLLRWLLFLQMGILASVPELQHVTPVGWRGEGQGERKSVNEHKPETRLELYCTWGWKLSSIIMSAPAVAASLASSVEQHSTSILLLKPHTERATFTA